MDSPSPQPAPLSYRRAEQLADVPDNCYRCGYPLLGIDDEQPCPECGLLARRSRRPSDELHNTRPRWLRRISRGANLILLAIVLAVIGPFIQEKVIEWVEQWIGFGIGFTGRPSMAYRLAVNVCYGVAVIAFFAGTWLLTSAEGYPPADRADRRLRRSLRLAALAPLVVLALYTAGTQVIAEVLFDGGNVYQAWPIIDVVLPTFSALACAPLPLLVFARLHGLAKRARSAHLAEHCSIVGIGASCALLFLAAIVILSENADTLGLGQNWMGRSNVALALMTLLCTAGCLFALWSLYLFVRFALAFRRAARQLRGAWHNDDRALNEPVPLRAT